MHSNNFRLKRSVKNQQKLKQEIAFQLLRVNSEEAVSMALDFFGPARLRNLDAFVSSQTTIPFSLNSLHYHSFNLITPFRVVCFFVFESK